MKGVEKQRSIILSKLPPVEPRRVKISSCGVILAPSPDFSDQSLSSDSEEGSETDLDCKDFQAGSSSLAPRTTEKMANKSVRKAIDSPSSDTESHSGLNDNPALDSDSEGDSDWNEDSPESPYPSSPLSARAEHDSEIPEVKIRPLLISVLPATFTFVGAQKKISSGPPITTNDATATSGRMAGSENESNKRQEAQEPKQLGCPKSKSSKIARQVLREGTLQVGSFPVLSLQQRGLIREAKTVSKPGPLFPKLHPKMNPKISRASRDEVTRTLTNRTPLKRVSQNQKSQSDEIQVTIQPQVDDEQKEDHDAGAGIRIERRETWQEKVARLHKERKERSEGFGSVKRRFSALSAESLKPGEGGKFLRDLGGDARRKVLKMFPTFETLKYKKE